MYMKMICIKKIELFPCICKFTENTITSWNTVNAVHYTTEKERWMLFFFLSLTLVVTFAKLLLSLDIDSVTTATLFIEI